jgi:hypothetical protein
MWKSLNGRQKAIGLALILICACASEPTASEDAVRFQSDSAAQNFVLHIYEDDRIVLRIDDEEFSFPDAELAYPRWAGQTYRAEANGHQLSLDIHTMRLCAADGAGSRRTASVLVYLDGAEMSGCGFFTNSPRR